MTALRNMLTMCVCFYIEIIKILNILISPRLHRAAPGMFDWSCWSGGSLAEQVDRAAAGEGQAGQHQPPHRCNSRSLRDVSGAPGSGS